jgi:flagella basal body P-ring formation protein FlgA
VDLEKAINNFILTYGKYKKENVLIEYKNLPEKVILNDQNVKLEISEAADIYYVGNTIIPINFVSNGKIIKRLPVSVKIRTFDSILVAAKKIEKNEIISTESIKKKWIETTYLYSQGIKNELECIAKRAIKYVPPGQPLTLNIIENLPIIKKGTPVKIVAKINRVVVSTWGIAKEDAKVGDTIEIEITNSKTKLKAKVIDKETVEIFK